MEKILKVAIIARVENYQDDYPFNVRYTVDNSYRSIFDELNVLIIPILSENNLKDIVSMCDFLILPGSAIGVDPRYYNDVPVPGKSYEYDEYKLDKKVIDLFVHFNKPIIAICGGLQTLNVYFGGDLNQNILNHKLNDNTKHKIKITSESFLSKVFNDSEIEVNSYHRQAIRRLASNFRVTAMSDEGIIEAIEYKNIIGVQWHPEILNDVKFFETFIDNFIKKNNCK